MKIENKKIAELQARALQLRIDSIRSTTASGSGHPTTCLSTAEIVSALFFESMNFDLENPHEKNNDRFILSKGHGVPVVYAAYKQLGVLSDEDLMQLRQFDSPLEGHPTSRFVYNEAATGSLGQGLAIGAGMAIHAKQEDLEYKTYVLLGDGELAEGSVWEAAAFASHVGLNNLIGIVDCNRLGQSNQTLYGHDIDSIAKRFESFGWQVLMVDGHDIEQLLNALATAKQAKDKPVMIIAKTFKGYGVDAFEDKNGFHGKPVKKEELESVLASLRERFGDERPTIGGNVSGGCATSLAARPISISLTQDPNNKFFANNQTIATRKAFGYALTALGRASKEIIALDADVKNSTYTDIFEKEFPERFLQCFIAEQTMVGVATGLQTRGKIPFVATFGAFLTRAHDQIRMAGVGKNALRICGSHCGVSIGQDGPSQMALEDLAMMRSIPDSVVLYPSDGISTYKLVECMSNNHDGISYLRTTRSATPILYAEDEVFEVGGCKVIRHSDEDKACVVAAGITLHEALKAYEILKEQGVLISVIDAYSVKPLDSETIKDVARKSGNRVIVVEDHYPEGGLGEAVALAMADSPSNSETTVESLAVTKLSRSGKPEELLAYAGIDAKSIVQAVLLR